MGSRPSLIYVALRRLDSLMAIGVSRHRAKQARRSSSAEKLWSVSTGSIHAHTTRQVYQQQVLSFIHWVQATYHLTQMACLDSRADELVSQYLLQGMAQGNSPATLQTQRAALRLFFGWQVADGVALPKRTRATIVRSRVPVQHDRYFQPQHWPDHILFASATGLRRSELRDLRVGDVFFDTNGQLVVHVSNGKGGKARDVAVLDGSAEGILAVLAGRPAHAHVFDHIPRHMDVQSYRRSFAQALYLHLAPGRDLPPSTARLSSTDYDAEAARAVSEALGHHRLSIVLTHYLR